MREGKSLVRSREVREGKSLVRSREVRERQVTSEEQGGEGKASH